MDENILEEGKKFLLSYLRDKEINYKYIHPWRNNWQFIMLHSLRVEGYVRKILEGEGQKLSYDELLLTRLAAILHDVGRIHKREGHAIIGRDIIKGWLEDNGVIRENLSSMDRLLYMIEKHSNKEEEETDYCLKVLRDADVLDEVGVLSVFMTSNWIDRSDPYFFNILSDRIKNFELPFCESGFKLLNTKTAKLILEEKSKFIYEFNKQLSDELYGTEMFREFSIEELWGHEAN